MDAVNRVSTKSSSLIPMRDLALAASPLRPIQGHRIPLDVAGVRDGDDHFFFGDHVLERQLGFLFDDLCARSSL